MAEAIKIVYVIIIFFSLFLIAMNVDALIKCTHVSDCPNEISTCAGAMEVKCHAFNSLLFPDPVCVCSGEMSLFLIS
ncbi:unnamed protein product [Trifolium pratense]|uniref:Uncharacterized protein n=1 Tax=Trifolium pratense TaxID=57577 RepID=A0ACB0J6D8_TRIPR|nr:unnamed protein product [Trifolium pratense]